MPPQHRPVFPLRVVTQRIAAAKAEDLPPITGQLAQLVVASKDILPGQTNAAAAKAIPDFDVVLHKFKTQLSTLLQDRNSTARWTAVALVKTFIGVGGQDGLQDCGPWVRSMVGILGQKTEHGSVKKLAILALTKIFLSTQEYPNLKREITTPSLQPFITHCLNSTCIRKDDEFLPRSKSPLLKTVLQAFLTLLPRHPAAFRVWRTGIRSMLGHLVAPTPSQPALTTGPHAESVSVPTAVTALAQKLLAILPHTAPNNATAAEWTLSLDTALSHAQKTADVVFRSIKEESARGITMSNHVSAKSDSIDGIGDEISDLFLLPRWYGLDAGLERLVGALQIIETHITTTNPATLSIPVVRIWQILERMLSVCPPSKTYQPSINPEIPRDEREALWSRLSEIHTAAVAVAETLLRRMGISAFSMGDIMMDRLAILFENGNPDEYLRRGIYQAFGHLVSLLGPSLSRLQIKSLQGVLQAACTDLEEGYCNAELSTSNTNPKQMGSGNLLGKPQPRETSSHLDSDRLSDQASSAVDLLELVLSAIQPRHLPLAVRAAIDRAIILASQKDVMLASVLNPPSQANAANQVSSILPFLARAHPEALCVESLIRPRLPVVRTEITRQIEADEDGSPGAMRAVNSSGILEHQDEELPRLGRVNLFSAALSTGSAFDSGNASAIAASDPIQSPKRARRESPAQSVPMWTRGQSPDPKRPRTDQPESAVSTETVKDKQSVTTRTVEVSRSDVGQVEPLPVPSRSMEAEDGSGSGSGSERSVTPELIIPDDFGVSSEEEDGGEDDGEGMQT